MANIVRFDPFEDLTRLQRDVNRLFEDNSPHAAARRSRPRPAPGRRR